MKKLIVFGMLTFLGVNINAQSVRLDSMISYTDIISENPTLKRIYQYDSDGRHTKTINWNTVSTEGYIEFKVTQMDSFYYNEEGLLSRVSSFGFYDGAYFESIRAILEYDDDGNNTAYISQGKNDLDNEWIDLWVWTNVFEEGRNVESIVSFHNPDDGTVTRLSRDEYIYNPNTNLLDQNNSFDYDAVTSEQKPTTRVNYFYDEDGFIERSDRYIYDAILSDFELNTISNHINDDFGNNLIKIGVGIDPNGEEIFRSKSTRSYDTNVELSQADLPNDVVIRISDPKHIILDITSESWEDEEWEINNKNIFYYSGLTGTEDLKPHYSLNIFPNPAVSTITINNDDLVKSHKMVQIINQAGSIVYKGRLINNQMNIEFLPTGLYRFILISENSTSNSNFIKF